MEPLRVFSDHVEILDQRQLPQAVRYLNAHRASDVVEAIRTLAVRGAPAIGIAGLYGLWLEARYLAEAGESGFMDKLLVAAQQLRHARPTAVNLSWAIDRALGRLTPGPADEVVTRLRDMADTLRQEEEERNARMAQLGAQLLPSRDSRVLTHCNTGSLATVGVGTALGVIREGYRQGRVAMVWVDETRPLLQGSRMTAWELLQDQIPATLITDSMAAGLMQQGQVDAVFVGADRIALNGDTANKVGTYGLAVLAQYHRIPFYVVAPVSTIDEHIASGQDIPIEERQADEVRLIRGVPIAPEGMAVKNPAFDVTPYALISAIITDRGVVYPPFDQKLRQLLEEDQHA
jgi:methylthioribose-1-phosphate isomerase